MNPQEPYQQQPGYPPPPPPGYQQPPQQGYAPPSGYPQQAYAPPPGYPPQPGYQQPVATSTNRWGPSSLGMESHVAAGLSYLSIFFFGPIIPLVFFFVEKQNRFVKFHAAQGILLNIMGIVMGVVWSILVAVLSVGAAASGADSSSGAAAGAGFALIGLGCVFSLLAVVLLAFVIWGTVAGFSGKYTKLPLVGGIAEKWAGGPAMALY